MGVPFNLQTGCLSTCTLAQYIPDVSRAVFGLLTAMQKRARDDDEVASGASKRAKGGDAASSSSSSSHLSVSKVGTCAAV